MKILMQSRYDLLKKSGGDTVQVLQTKKALETLGVDVTLDCSPSVDLAAYDLVHLFNLDWVRDTYRQAKNCVKQNKPYVLSPIHHRLIDIKIWEDNDRYDFKRLAYLIFRTYGSREFLKSAYRTVFNPLEVPDFISQLGVGVKASQKWVVENSSYLLPNACAEAEVIKEDVSDKFCYHMVPNGVDKTFYKADPAEFVKKYGSFPFILSVGRIESRKNQLRIIEAVKKIREDYPEMQLVLVGSFNAHHLEYGLRVRKEIKDNKWIKHIPMIPYTEIPPVFAAAKTHVLASWKETTGLVNVEAVLAGCGVVAPNKGYCYEYLGSEVEYCDPSSIPSIVSAIKKSFVHKPSELYKNLILEKFTWEETAKATLKVYNKVLTEDVSEK